MYFEFLSIYMTFSFNSLSPPSNPRSCASNSYFLSKKFDLFLLIWNHRLNDFHGRWNWMKMRRKKKTKLKIFSFFYLIHVVRFYAHFLSLFFFFLKVFSIIFVTVEKIRNRRFFFEELRWLNGWNSRTEGENWKSVKIEGNWIKN